MHDLPSLVAVALVDLDQPPEAVVPREQDPALLERLADGAHAVCLAVGVSRGIILRGDCAVVKGIKVAAREHMCGREGGGLLDAVEEEDCVLRGDEDHALTVLALWTTSSNSFAYLELGRASPGALDFLGSGFAGGMLGSVVLRWEEEECRERAGLNAVRCAKRGALIGLAIDGLRTGFIQRCIPNCRAAAAVVVCIIKTEAPMLPKRGAECRGRWLPRAEAGLERNGHIMVVN